LSGLLLRDSLPAGYIPTSVATGDFNGDGNTDFVIANGGDNTLWLYSGKGDGTFNLPIILPVTLGQTPVWVAAADLRGIGTTDLIVVNTDSNNVSVFLGKGGGTFTETSIALPGSASTLAIGDFNHDGKLDIAVPMNDEDPLTTQVHIYPVVVEEKQEITSPVSDRRLNQIHRNSRVTPWVCKKERWHLNLFYFRDYFLADRSRSKNRLVFKHSHARKFTDFLFEHLDEF